MPSFIFSAILVTVTLSCCSVMFSAIRLDAKSGHEVDSIGPCVNGKCPEKFFCDNDYNCYPDGWKPLGKIIGRCINNLCPAKHICQMDYCVQQTKGSSPGLASPIGPCVNKLCPSGYTCRNSNCYFG